jgi:hypothetical protein
VHRICEHPVLLQRAVRCAVEVAERIGSAGDVIVLDRHGL